MPFSIDSALGINEQALRLQARRAELLASNLANADTPGYKARDIDFKAVLASYSSQGGSAERLATTEPGHIGSAGANGSDGETLYRVPAQASIDGNTVDGQVEKTAYMENALRYQASLDFINGTIKSLRSAIKGD